MSMKERFTFVYKIRGLLMVPPFLVLTFIFGGETESEYFVWPMGLALFALGVLLRVWAQMHVHYRLRLRKTLTTSGPYAFARNPIYIANTAMLLGLTVMSELLWFLPVMLVWCALVYGMVIRREEAHLLAKYGAPYADYLKRVPRWLPRFGGSGNLGTPHTFHAGLLRASIVAELHCLLWLIPLVGKELFATFH